MLAGYLPFDDDPANPEGDNINLLYKYITQTPLTFPEYVSAMARDLLRQILKPNPEQRMTLKAVKAHTWLYPYRNLFRTPISDFEAQAKESISHLSATAMGRSVSAHESHSSYIAPSTSRLAPKAVSPPSSPEVKSATLDPRRHTVQVEYDRPSRGPEDPKKKVLLDIPVHRTSPKKEEGEISALGVPPAPALIRSATTGGTTSSRPTMTLDTVDERSPEKPRTENRPSSQSSSTSGVTRPPTARPAMPHGSKPRPTSYHPPSSAGGVAMSKGRSVSGDRTATLILQHRSSSGSSRKVYNEPSPTAPISSYQNVSGEILQSTTPPQEIARMKPTPPSSEMGPPPVRSKTHKRASASISMVADRVFGFFTTGKTSPNSSPQRIVSNPVGMTRSNTTTRKVPVLGGPPGATVLSKKREKPTTPSKTSITRSATDIPISSPASKYSKSPVHSTTLPRNRTESHFPVPELLPPPSHKAAKKLGEMAPEKGSTGAARRVMEFFRRRASRME